MSKRKQIRPSKFDMGKKDDSQQDKSLSSGTSPKSHDIESSSANDSGESSRKTEVQIRKISVVNVPEPAALVARDQDISKSRTSGVIVQAISRKRAASEAFGSNNADQVCGSVPLEKKQVKSNTDHRHAACQTSMDTIRQQVEGKELTKVQVNNSQRFTSTVEGGQLTNTNADASCQVERRHLTKAFLCQFCGTRFSNPATLEAHQAIYCMKKSAETKTLATDTPSMTQSSRLNLSTRHEKGVVTTGPSSPETVVKTENTGAVPDCSHPGPSTSSDFDIAPFTSTMPSVILLPCAYNSSNSIQVLGKPQTVIPIAIPKTFLPFNFMVTPLQLERSWCRGIDISNYELPLSAVTMSQSPQDKRSSSSALKNPFTFPLEIRKVAHETESVVRTNAAHLTTPDGSNKQIRLSDDTTQPTENGGHCSRSPPLDLTTKTSPSTSSALVLDGGIIKRHSLPTLQMPLLLETRTIQSRMISSSPPLFATAHPKNYACPKCGVAFSSRKTLEGHQMYYCKAVKPVVDTIASTFTPSSSAQGEQQPSSSNSQTLCCQYCDHAATTPWLLLQHMKNNHALGSAYLCTLCGYRGFSMRGMKSHLKHAHVDESILDSDQEDAVSKYIRKTKLFGEYDTAVDDDDLSHSGSSRSDSDVSDQELAQSNKTSPSAKMESSVVKTASQRAAAAKRTSTSTSPQQTLTSRYSCQFCAYNSPYKGNVKRHLALVHKVEKQKD